MKRNPSIIVLCLALAAIGARAEPAGPSPSSPPPMRIATVDMQELFGNYHRSEETQKQLNVDRARIQKENNERHARIRETQEQLELLRKQLEDPSVNESRKATLFKDWQSAQQQAIALERERAEFMQRRTQMLNEKMVRSMKTILEEIRLKVVEQAKIDNFDHVLDRSGLSSAQVPVLLYSKDSTDITAVLLKTLNHGKPEATSGTKPDRDGALDQETAR
jgi:Skp family chaperone for outer membrane proteins